MASEIIKTKAICLGINAWSRTSHVVKWLTENGLITTLVKGAVRPKSAFLGQYDLNYTCEILYYARAKGEVHAIREVFPIARRDGLRDDYRQLALAGYFRRTAIDFTPSGSDAKEWFELLETSLDKLTASDFDSREAIVEMLEFELKVLEILGISPNIEAELGEFTLRGERKILISRDVARCIRSPRDEKNMKILLDASRVIGVFYQFHLDCALDVRRIVQGIIYNNKEEKGQIK